MIAETIRPVAPAAWKGRSKQREFMCTPQGDACEEVTAVVDGRPILRCRLVAIKAYRHNNAWCAF